MSNVLLEALHVTSVSVTQRVVKWQHYARGLVTGILAAMLQQGNTNAYAVSTVRDCLPDDVDPEALPPMMTDEQASLLISCLDTSHGPKIDDDYSELLLIFMPKRLFNMEEVHQAQQALEKARNKPRGQRSYAVECYVDLVDSLIAQFKRDMLEKFTNEYPQDKVILNFLLKLWHVSQEGLQAYLGVSDLDMEELLVGGRNLTRREIAAICKIYKIKPEIFDYSEMQGLPHRRFQVIEHFNGFDLKDRTTGLTHWLSDGVDAVSNMDSKGEEFTVSPGAFGFSQMWEAALNDNEYETLEAYFPATLDAEIKADHDADPRNAD